MPQSIGNHTYQIYTKNAQGVYSSNPTGLNLNVTTCVSASQNIAFIPLSRNDGGARVIGRLDTLTNVFLPEWAIPSRYSVPLFIHTSADNQTLYIGFSLASDSDKRVVVKASVNNSTLLVNSESPVYSKILSTISAITPNKQKIIVGLAGSNGGVAIIDTATLDMVEVSGMPANYGVNGIVVDPSGANAFAVGGNSSSVIKISIASAAVSQTATVAGMVSAGSLIYDPEGFLYIEGNNELYKINANTLSGQTTISSPIVGNKLIQSGMRIEKNGRYIYGKFAFLDEGVTKNFILDTSNDIATVASFTGVRKYDPSTLIDRVYISTSGTNPELSILSTQTNTVITTIPIVGQFSPTVKYSVSGNMAFV